MRLLLALLFALAIGKVATQSYIQQQAAKNTIINAYREHALAACQQYAAETGAPTASANMEVRVDLMIGRKDLPVRLWQTSHSKWSARYQDPILVVVSHNARQKSVCEYDIKSGTILALDPNAIIKSNG